MIILELILLLELGNLAFLVWIGWTNQRASRRLDEEWDRLTGIRRRP